MPDSHERGPPPLALAEITPLIITYNEAPNIRQTVDRLVWANRIVVIDSGSDDETLAMLQDYPQAEVIHHPFADFAGQCNFGLTQITTPWVLSLDADYELSDRLVRQLGALAPSDGVGGYRARFVYRVHGRPLRGSLYPPRTVLYRKDRAVYQTEGHGHRVIVGGDILLLDGVIYHDDRKPPARWFSSQRRYARDEAAHLLDPRRGPLNWTDRVRVMAWPAPLGALFYALLVKGCLFDGWAGWYYALQRMVAEALIALEIIDRRLHRRAAAASREQRAKNPPGP